MPGLSVRLEDQGRQFKITKIGQLVTAPFDYNEVSEQILDNDNTAKNLFEPRPGSSFVITSMVVSTHRNVGTTGALVEVFEAASITSGVATKSLFTLQLDEKTTVPLMGLNLLVNQGVYINAKADDSDVSVSIMGYYIPVSA